MEINITEFVKNSDPFDFSASIMERGKNAGPETWNNAVEEAKTSSLLTTEEQLEALRDYVKEFGAWSEEQIAAWSDDECNALFIQLISGDMREAGLDSCDLEEFDWAEYERRSQAGQISGNIFKSDDGLIYYQLSH